ncbi:hypothetical protein I6A84_29475 [Frankia sp. CNm7]|uniref:Uncharacterized protein n=1 Tax=Frankia nepalensis TaxID=1836974 RepID=A0A937UJD3_9ACTN|nr:hypothetical protein [Frankia nepalensis]MBL7502357.1 hypothetical protein [Frankia nepalensis]MBL7516190.1 hypothetical protein [Frankia nepalensis]MBL7522096.1 hypothetical protein [Frankia nepalensis]MBL7625679.1 hypothetical protein [Frankia nepalensis]
MSFALAAMLERFAEQWAVHQNHVTGRILSVHGFLNSHDMTADDAGAR